MIEASYPIITNTTFKYKYTNFNFDDGSTTTEDTIKAYELELTYQYNNFFSGIRSSFWRPQSNSMSSSAPSVPGLLTTTDTSAYNDQIQIGIGYHLNESSLLKLEYTYNDYLFSGNTTDKVSGLITGINVSF